MDSYNESAMFFILSTFFTMAVPFKQVAEEM